MVLCRTLSSAGWSHQRDIEDFPESRRVFFNNPKDVNPDEIKDVNISGEMTFRSRVVKDHFKITFNIKNVVIESGNEKKYIDIDGNVFSTN